MVAVNLVVYTGGIDSQLWHKLVSNVYSAIDAPNVIEELNKTFEDYAVTSNKARWDITEQETSKALLTTGGRKFGQALTFPMTVSKIDGVELVFGLNKWAAGKNGEVIAHLLSINGKVKLWKAWDPRILKAYKRGDGVDPTWPVGFDISPTITDTDVVKGIRIKSFMGEDNYALFKDLVSGDQFGLEGSAQSMEHVGAWIAIKQAIAVQAKKYPDYTIADLVRLTVGDVPRDIEVDSTNTTE